VRVTILEPGYEKIQPDQIRIMVVEPFVIEPSRPVYILPTSEYKFNLAKLIMGEKGDISRERISTPSEKYQWSVSNATIGSIL